MNPSSPLPEVERELAAIGARAVIAGPKAKAAIGELDRVRAAGAGARDRERGRRCRRGASPLDDLLAAEPVPVVDRGADDLAVLIFTSGTAGSPKAAMLTHGNLLANLEQCQAHPGRQQGADDVVLGVLPLFHIFGLNVVLGLSLVAGAAVLLVERFDPQSAHRVDRAARRHRHQRRAHHVVGVGEAARRAGRRLCGRAPGHIGQQYVVLCAFNGRSLLTCAAGERSAPGAAGRRRPGHDRCAGPQLQREFSIVGVAEDADSAVELAGRCQPDVALVDVEMPGGGLLATASGLVQGSPDTAIVILTSDGSRFVGPAIPRGRCDRLFPQGDVRAGVGTRVREAIAAHRTLATQVDRKRQAAEDRFHAAFDAAVGMAIVALEGSGRVRSWKPTGPTRR